MTALAQNTAQAVETLKKIAKPIPFATEWRIELRNIQRLLREGRAVEAEQRLTRLFDDGHLDIKGADQNNARVY